MPLSDVIGRDVAYLVAKQCSWFCDLEYSILYVRGQNIMYDYEGTWQEIADIMQCVEITEIRFNAEFENKLNTYDGPIWVKWTVDDETVQEFFEGLEHLLTFV